MTKSTRGFTIVELLIVIVVIAVLAAISIVVYNGIQARTYDVTVQADLHAVVNKMQEYQAANGAFPTASSSQLTAANLKFTRTAYYVGGNNVYFCRDKTSDNYSFTAQSLSGNRYTISSFSPAVKSYSGGWGTAAVCPNTGISDYSGTAAYISSAWGTWAGQ